MSHLFPADLFNLAGYAGAACLVGSYAALQSGLIRGNGYAYAFLNLLGAALLLLSLTNQTNLSALAVEISWIALSVFGMVRVFLLNHTTRFSDQETELLSRKFPGLSTVSARRFLNEGLWIDAEPDTVLIREGEAHGALIYLATGSADVFSGDKHVGVVEAGNFLGEMTVLQGTPATATVVLAEPGHYFRVEAEQLWRLSRRDAEFQLQLENSLSQDTRLKLAAANARMRDTNPRPDRA